MPRFRNASLVPGFLLPLTFLLHLGPILCADVPLPTPREHYDSPDPSAESLLRLAASIGELDPSQQLRILGLLQSQDSAGGQNVSIDELMAILKSIDWEKHRADILELFLHRSRVLDIIPKESKDWLPIVHDSLLFFLHHLDEKRLVRRLFNQARLPTEADRGQYLLGFLSQTPTLQKIGQILARNPSIPGDLRAALQVLENSLRTTHASDLTRFTLEEIGEEAAKKYQVQFSDQVLAEATVGAVLRCTLILPGQKKRTEAVVKIIKPHAVSAMQEELAIFDDLTRYFAAHRETYEIGAIPISETFNNVRQALSKEIVIVEEQKNLTRAGHYYRGNPRVLVPKLYPLSTDRVTFMEFVHGEKVAAAFAGKTRSRAKLARRLLDLLAVDVLLAQTDEALFHGDPHSGNVFHVLDDPADPFRLALLDWGLSGNLPHSQREALMQLFLGIFLKDSKRLRNHVGALIEGDSWETESGQKKVRRLVEQTLTGVKGESAFDILGELMKNLGREGYKIRFTLGLFIKAQITISGILSELDPKLKPDRYLVSRLSNQVLKEMPKRLLYTLWFPRWNSHQYRSMLSNEDVRDIQFALIGRAFRKLGRVF